jgi:hypothetical protein
MTIRADQLVKRLIVTGEVVLGALSIFLFGPGKAYHPERHYMRGPGPKWREKHGIVQVLAHDEARG